MSRSRADTVRDAAKGHWRHIFISLAGISDEYFVDRERSCPTCNGTTRWRVYSDFNETGGCRCNACDKGKGWGDGFAFLKWKLKKTFREVVKMVGELLDVPPGDSVKKRRQPAKKAPAKPLPDGREALRKEISELERRRKEIMKAGDDFTTFDAELASLREQFGNITWLAEELGVSASSLEALGVAWNQKNNAWQNPEFDSGRNVIGTSKRLADGSKGFVSGGHRGLYYALDWMNSPGPVIVVEGMSDTAGGITLGSSVIGRPSKDVPKALRPHLLALLATLPANRQIIVLGENDKSVSDWPGKEGAVSTAGFLAAGLKRSIQWALPPEGVKDLRSWLQANRGKSVDDFIQSLTIESVCNSDAREPSSEIDPKEDAEFFLQNECRHDDGLTLRFYRSSFWAWKDNRWVECSIENVRANIALYLGDRYSRVTISAISNVLEFVKALVITPDATRMPSWLDGRAGYSITFNNGIATLDDLILGKQDCLRPHSPAWFSEVALPYEFQPDASCDIWLDMLIKNLEFDGDRGNLLQEFAGYCLQHSTEFHAMLMLTGDGGNGKSCVLSGISGMLGIDNVSSLSLDELAEKFKLPRIIGKLANICADMPDTSKTCEGTLKKLTSGDPLEFERKNQQPFTAVSTAKLIFSTNTLPQFYDRSSGLWRRLIIMPFNRAVEDHERVTGMDSPAWWLKRGELPGIFMWAIRGLQRLRMQGGFTHSQICDTAIREHRRECNTALSWLLEEYEHSEIGEIDKAVMYSEYAEHCRRSGLKALGVVQFAKEVRKAFGPLQEQRRRFANNRFRVLVGIDRKDSE